MALATASHSGEPVHLEVVRELLELAGVTEGELGCPESLPLDEPAQRWLLRRGLGPARIQHNCSGKHAAMLAACRATGWPLADYLSPDHPLQQHVRRTLEELAGEGVAAVAVDGCGAPLHALTLSGLARAFSRLVTAPEGSAELRVATAMRAHPELVGGTGRDVTTLMTGVPGLLAKDGAEGCYAAATADGVGVALKIDDGAARARTPLLIAALRALGVAGEQATLDALAAPPVLGGGMPVGVVRVPALLASPLAFASTTRLS